MQPLTQNIPNSPVQNTGGQSIWGNVGSFLNGALDTYARYEQIKAGQNPANVYAEKTNLTPLPSGQAVVVESASATQGAAVKNDTVTVAGYQIAKPIAYGGAALIAFVLAKKLGVL